MIRLSPPGHGRIEFRPRWKCGSAAASTTSPMRWRGLGCAPASSAGWSTTPSAGSSLNHGRAVGMDMSHVVDGQVRRRRPRRPHRPELHRSRHRRARQRHDVRPRPLRRHEHEAGHDRLQERLRQAGRPLAAHRRHLRRPVRRLAPPCARKRCIAAREAGTIVSYDLNFRSKLWSSQKAQQVTKELVPLHRLPDRQRRRLPEGARLRGRRRGRELSALDTGRLQEDGREGRQGLPQHQGRRHHAARGEERPGQQLVGHPLATKANSTKAAASTTWRSKTASAAATASPAASPTASSRQTPQECVDLGAAHGALLQTTRGDTSQIDLEELMHVFGGGGAGSSGEERNLMDGANCASKRRRRIQIMNFFFASLLCAFAPARSHLIYTNAPCSFPPNIGWYPFWFWGNDRLTADEIRWQIRR